MRFATLELEGGLAFADQVEFGELVEQVGFVKGIDEIGLTTFSKGVQDVLGIIERRHHYDLGGFCRGNTPLLEISNRPEYRVPIKFRQHDIEAHQPVRLAFCERSFECFQGLRAI